MKIMVTSFKRPCACTASLIAPDPAAGHHRPMPLLEIPGCSQASLGQSLVGSLLLSPGSWCTQVFLCVLSKSLFPQSCVSSGSSMVGIMATSFKRSHACTATLSAPSSAAGHHQPTTDPRLHWRLLETLGKVWVSVLWGHCSFLLGPECTQVSVCALQESISQSCVSSGSSMMGLMLTSSKRAYAIPKSAAPRAPVPVAVHC